MKKNIIKLGELIKKSKKILLINHIRMDMDAFGSLSSIYTILNSLNKNVKAVNDELTINSFSFLGYNHIIETNLDIEKFKPDLIISFDAASKEQLGNTYKDNEDIFKNTNFVVIDHHKTNSGFGDINIIDPNYSSTCELTYDIIHSLNLNKYITPGIATSLLSGIYTDTNIFYNSNTTSNTYLVASELIKSGADFRKPYYELYKKKTFNKSQLWGEILANHLKISENGKISWAIIPKTTFSKTNTSDRDTTGIISEFFANIEGVEICFISYELENKKVKTSFRSTKNIDSTIIASHFGGGGHKQACGFTSNKTLKQIELEILEQIKKQFNF